MSLFNPVQEAVATALRAAYPDKRLFITAEEANGAPPSFPAIVLQLDDEYSNQWSQDLQQIDVDRTRAYKVEVYSNALVGKVEETLDIVHKIIPVMADHGYRMTTNACYPSMDSSVARRVARFYNYHVLPNQED